MKILDFIGHKPNSKIDYFIQIYKSFSALIFHISIHIASGSLISNTNMLEKIAIIIVKGAFRGGICVEFLLMFTAYN